MQKLTKHEDFLDFSKIALPTTSLSDPTHEDAELVAAAQHGDEAAFTTLMQTYWSPIYAYLLRLTGESEQAADLTQETFFKAYKAINRLQTGAGLGFRPWLYKIATNLAINYTRRRKYFRWLSLDHLINDQHERGSATLDNLLTDATLASETSTEVAATLKRLPPNQAALILLRFYHDLTIEEIGWILKIEPGAVRARLHRARLPFRRLYNDYVN